MCFAPPRLSLFRHRTFQKSSEVAVFCTFWLGNVLRATTACTLSTAQLPKVLRTWGVFTFLTSTCASRHNSVHFFDIATSKSGLRPLVFDTFDLEMCFAPQRRALFRRLTFQKWSEPGVFCTFWLGNVLRATTACNFSSLVWPAVSATRRFSEVTFRPSGATNHWKNTVNRDFPTFSRTCIFFLLTFSISYPHFLTSPPWLFPPLLFQLCILPEVWLLNFLRLIKTSINKWINKKIHIYYKYENICHNHSESHQPKNNHCGRSCDPRLAQASQVDHLAAVWHRDGGIICIWGFPEMGLLPIIIHWNKKICHIFNHLFWASPFIETPIWRYETISCGIWCFALMKISETEHVGAEYIGVYDC